MNRKNDELRSHDEAKPHELPRPAITADGTSGDTEVLADLQAVERRRLEIAHRMEIATTTLSGAERRLVIARRILEKLDNFRKDFEVFSESLVNDVSELGLSVSDLVSLRIDTLKPTQVRDEISAQIRVGTADLESTEPPGLRRQKEQADLELNDLRSKLDAPNRTYQAFLKAVADWEDRRHQIQGEESDADSLEGLQASLNALDGMPAQIDLVRKEQIEVALQIHAEKLGQVEVYRQLYLPVQQFIDGHNLAKDKLRLEFRAELIEFEFAKRLLEHVSQNRKGSFMGLEEGKGRAERYAQVTDWTKSDAVRKFLEEVDEALHFNLRDSDKPSVPLKAQLVGSKKPEEVFNYLYGLDYVSPRYVLRWEGKDLSMLSPGERGTLLLVFYLLIDKGDMPLVIDQPEGNLDNHTVAKMLVDCIKEARNRRQVFIVTHNPNLAVVCDADQVIHASMDKEAGHAVTYTSGALENAGMSKFITDVLEGTRWAFGVRSEKYGVAE
jgi:hypothetical protein